MRKILLFFIAISLLPLPAQALYKWVDSKGVVHYSDKVPPEEAKYGREVINERGRTVDRVEGAKTKEELKKAREERKRQQELKRQRELKAKHDRMLLMTYESLGEIEAARDQKISTIENAIGLANGTLDTQKKRLRGLRGKAAEYERSSKPIPKRVHNNMGQTRKQIAQTEDYIQRKREEQRLIRVEFDGYIKRYKELRE